MGKKNGISFNTGALMAGMTAYSAEFAAALVATFEYYADRAQSDMKSNAPWTDRTSNARNSLNAQAFTSPTKYTLVLYHQMPYGIWLEVRWDGKYAIIMPTIESLGPELMNTISEIQGRLGV